MASQSSFEEMSTPVETPSTPQPLGAELPTKADIPRSTSPTTSMIVAGSSSALHSSSITPPPSSQAPHLFHANSSHRFASPGVVIPSSPPPTVNGARPREGAAVGLTRPTKEELESCTHEELLAMVQKVISENAGLEAIASEARMSAAHYKLQHNLLTIESEEALKRMEVEHDMTRREVQVLQFNGQGREAIEFIPKLKAYCKSLEEENIALHRRLEKAKKVIEATEDDLMDQKEENARLRARIRQNREHINTLRSPGGPLHISTPKTGPSTPQQYRYTPKHTPNTNRSVRYVREHTQDNQEKFNALLLAGSVLSQENNSAPSTPVMARRTDARTPTSRHSRGVQSLSSLPTTPSSGRGLATSHLLPSAQFSPQAEARVAETLGHVAAHSRERRRKSRDSTISASDNEEIARAAMHSFRGESEEVEESQASQSATEMLRTDPRESFEVAASRTTTPNPGDKASVHQAKIFGSVTKGVMEKRKRDEEFLTDHSPAKKIRALEGVGLGIGFEAGRG